MSNEKIIQFNEEAVNGCYKEFKRSQRHPLPINDRDSHSAT